MLYCDFCKKRNHTTKNCFFRKKVFNTRKSNLGVGDWSDYIWNREGDWWKRENTRKLAKSEPTEPTNNIHTPNNDSKFEYTTTTKKQNITKRECEKVIEHFKTRLEENYENISTDSDKKSKSDNDKLKLKLKIKRLEKSLEMQKKDLVSKYENLKKENEILKKENLSLSLLYFSKYSSDYFNSDKN